LRQIAHGGRPLRAVSLSADGAWLAAAEADGMLRCWRLADGRLVSATASKSPCSALVMSPDGRYLAAAGARGPVHIQELPSGRTVASIAAGRRASCLGFTRDGSGLAVGTARGDITLWDVASGLPIAALVEVEAPLECLALSPDGGKLVAAGRDGTLWLRRLPIQPVPSHIAPRFHPVATTVLGSGQRLFDWLRRVALL
jgi:WD40 repeat protein